LRAVIGLGANLGDRLGSLRAAVTKIAELGEVVARSRVYETDPVGAPPPRYLNAAVLLDTGLRPEVLMQRLLSVEESMGRVRRERNEPRGIDLDILWIDGMSLSTETLVVPHPRLLERAFALGPMLEVAPDAIDPRTKRRYADAPSSRIGLVTVGEL
jgi:2-amino-4-hydroxy-6-hydroxymethyldihydropteridine diphosphokinase